MTNRNVDISISNPTEVIDCLVKHERRNATTISDLYRATKAGVFSLDSPKRSSKVSADLQKAKDIESLKACFGRI